MTPASPGFWEQYANVFIPLAIAVVSGWGSIQLYKEKINNISKDVDELKKECKDLRDRVIKSETCLQERSYPPYSQYLQRKSPVSLTKDGEELLGKSGGKLFVTENFEALYRQIEEKTPKTAYDVQELAKEVLKNYVNDDKLVPIKEFAFKEGLELDLLLTIMAIELRDLALKKKGWNREDVDKSDPTLKKEM